MGGGCGATGSGREHKWRELGLGMLLRHRRTSQVSLMLQSSSFSSITDSTMSLNIITVTLNMGEWEACMESAVLPEQDWVVERELGRGQREHVRGGVRRWIL